MAEPRKVLLIDGHSLAYRAFFALPDTLATSAGQTTNAVYGFTSMLLKALANERPDAVIVAFDGPRALLRRTEEYPDYKAHRPTMPDELRSQMRLIEDLLVAMRIPTVQVPGYEADDVLGGMARRVAGSGDFAVILTGDKDALQLVGDGVEVVLTGRGITETDSYDRQAVEAKYGVPPEKIPEIVGLKGDPSDNIPGVPGIGEKGACSLIQKYGSLDNLYEHIDEVSGEKRRSALLENRDMAYLSRDLAVIDTGLPLELDPGTVEFEIWDRQEVIDHLVALEFRTLARRFMELFPGSRGEAGAEPGGEIAYSVVDPTSADSLKRFEEDVARAGAVALAAELDGSGYCEIRLKSFALCTGGLSLSVDTADRGPAAETARRVLASPVEKWVHDGKGLLEALGRERIAIENVSFDTAVAAYLENPSLGTYSLWELWQKSKEERIVVEGRAEEVAEQASLLAEDVDGRLDLRMVTEAARVFHLKPILDDLLHSSGMAPLFLEVEMPLMLVLKEMEETGVSLDTELLKGLSGEAADALAMLEREIFELAGHVFNVGSTRQLAEVLFGELGLTPVKKTKTGFSTDSSVLESLKAAHPIAGKVVEYREFSKLKSTYFDALPLLVCPSTGKIHCSFNQTVTTTGRISSSNPNLQNIPVRTDAGRRIREGFLPGIPGWKMLVADYSQIELRVLAHMSGDTSLLDAFEKDADIHTETASEVFGVGVEDVTPEMRRVAKMVNFGVVYGMGYYGLSTRLGISMEEATRFIDTYFERYEGVAAYRDRCISETAERGYAETLLGRRRFIPELSSSNRQTREFGERLAINTPLQGTAADIIKKAMVDVWRALHEGGFESRMTVQIHDELIFDVPPEESEAVLELATRLMSGVIELRVPLKVDACLCDNWGEAKQ